MSAHPILYTNDDCQPGSEWLKLSKKKMPNDRLWTSRDEEESFSSWIALPGHKNLGPGRHWHFLIDAFWIATGLVYYILLFATGEWQRLIPTSWQIFPAAWQTLLEYLHLHIVHDFGAYNPLQQLSYAAVVFLLAPLSIITGLAMSPAFTGRFPWYLKIFGGRQKARSLHDLCLLAFVIFVILHTTMVFLHGFAYELGTIVLGEVQNVNLSLALVVGLFGLAVVVRKWFGHDPQKWDEFRKRYFQELHHHPETITTLRDSAKKSKVTLVYSARDTEHNNAVALKDYLLSHPGWSKR